MNLMLIGMPLPEAIQILRASGTEPEVQITSAPRIHGRNVLRVLRVSPDGKKLTAAPFPVPETDGQAETQK